MNAIERLRTLGTPWTLYEVTGRLVKERVEGGRPFFKEKRKVSVMAAVPRVRNALSAETNIHLL